MLTTAHCREPEPWQRAIEQSLQQTSGDMIAPIAERTCRVPLAGALYVNSN
ncbi:MAG: hypothetical protein QNJ46_21600 [Leptolyngbyaceae cyanobacterium MO_188.B28]|nr:hypothetical protein [Leptolyngbyaceae cyanobacterium MO_188.B28]